ACRIGVSREMVQFSGRRNIHFPTQNFFLNSLDMRARRGFMEANRETSAMRKYLYYNGGSI
ncbi:hypothetical protein, partial [Paenibacillus dendritiformis]|uniref:hypothetical protein n=1 Tax=Paenibacillus dendritiformis TaxID=130049 RepID=UPI00387E1089